MIHPTQDAPQKKWNLIKYWIPVILYCCLIVYLSAQSYPSQHIPSFLFGLSDKLVHGVEYGILGILLYQAFHQTTPTIGSITLAVICALIFGISDEIHQWFVPHRQADTLDLLADVVGATFFVFAWVFLTKQYASYRQALHDTDIRES